jgi:aspartate/glutamate racemase
LISRIGLLCTAFTLEHGFFQQRLARLHGLETIVPEPADRA